jgi:hypothetical protein
MTDLSLLALDDKSLVETLTDYAMRHGHCVYTEIPSPLIAQAVNDAEAEILRRLGQVAVCDHA